MKRHYCHDCTAAPGHHCICERIIAAREARLYRDQAPQFADARTHATERDSIDASSGLLIAAGLLAMTALYVLAFVS
ncbi:hypothetical protein [Sphingomonas sp.]|jgi:hypothetical protein|uniref:hypothetical protein n=1 Tax=Sphingomonas sp. TaxID=28214 RepID=UPI00356302E8